MARERTRNEDPGGLFLQATTGPQRFSSGCALLDCVMGGGWPRGRVSNVVGDFSTGKTQLAIEACANYALVVPDGKIVYCETEAAFDQGYAQRVGLPADRVLFPNGQESGIAIDTVEKLIKDIDKRLAKVQHGMLYVVDSMDAISDEAEKARDLDKGTYGAAKPKLLSEFFRTRGAEMARKDVTLLIVSQVRDAIGVLWGKKQRRSGGKALDFYSSLVVWLAKVKTIERTVKKVKRAVGVQIRAKAEKNKVGTPNQDCEFPIYFNFGIDDVEAAFDWFEETGLLKVAHEAIGFGHPDIAKMDPKEYRRARAKLNKFVREAWADVDEAFLDELPQRSKYG